ncbi:hypothetical protein A2U01_0059656 [Trifolium medium]|uniref:Uncharacterized protein n=1 Tax=Trifolium medium TaxID=97028 RepID=A0A392RP46_9FABA|nr:hypothetical protein [Trifolium medium]
MTGEKQLFQTLTLEEGGTVGFGGNQKGKIIGIGTVGNSFWTGLKHRGTIQGPIAFVMDQSKAQWTGYPQGKVAQKARSLRRVAHDPMIC